MRRRNWALYIWYALAALETLAMLALILCYACDVEERLG